MSSAPSRPCLKKNVRNPWVASEDEVRSCSSSSPHSGQGHWRDPHHFHKHNDGAQAPGFAGPLSFLPNSALPSAMHQPSAVHTCGPHGPAPPPPGHCHRALFSDAQHPFVCGPNEALLNFRPNEAAPTFYPAVTPGSSHGESSGWIGVVNPSASSQSPGELKEASSETWCTSGLYSGKCHRCHHYCFRGTQIVFVVGIIAGFSLLLAGGIFPRQKASSHLQVLMYIGAMVSSVCIVLLVIFCAVSRSARSDRTLPTQLLREGVAGSPEEVPLTRAPVLSPGFGGPPSKAQETLFMAPSSRGPRADLHAMHCHFHGPAIACPGGCPSALPSVGFIFSGVQGQVPLVGNPQHVCAAPLSKTTSSADDVIGCERSALNGVPEIHYQQLWTQEPERHFEALGGPPCSLHHQYLHPSSFSVRSPPSVTTSDHNDFSSNI